MKILLVDDEETIVLGIRHHLEQLENVNLEIVCAYSSYDALEIVSYFHPDLMIVDVRMPGMDGLELIDQIRHRYSCENIIILSAYRNFEYAQQAIESKVLHYLLKPVSYDMLDAIIRDMASAQKRQLDIPEILSQYKKNFPLLKPMSLPVQLKQITLYIQENFSNQVSLTELSKVFHLSESGICLLFKRELSTSFVTYLSEVRIWKAMNLLLSGPSLNVDQIAFRVGYQTNRQLFRLFKKKLGISPIGFRDQWINKEK